MMPKEPEYTLAVSPREMPSVGLGLLGSEVETGRALIVQPVTTLSALAQHLEGAGLGPTHGDLDSIEDSLASLDMYEAAGKNHLLVFEDLAPLAEHDARGFSNLLRVLADAQSSFQEESPETVLNVIVCLCGWAISDARRLVARVFPESPPAGLRVLPIEQLLATREIRDDPDRE